MIRIFHGATILAIVITATLPGSLHANAQNVIRIDATTPVPPPQPVAAKLGTSRNPKGQEIGVNSQYLTLDNKPWLPVMGEFHFSRYPEAKWEEEILKMKAAGVQIISAYIIWIHHEQIEGVFDWSGQRDLRRFVELCGKHGMYVYPRIGPWAHAETRNGGLPDWVLKNSSVRQNDPVYLNEVQGYYSEIAKQLQGLFWKDGGPVIGIQIENEYHETGLGKGAEHIRTLKDIALKEGMDVPLYTVTGWDRAVIPLDAVLPVFGGYPDAPWDTSDKTLPANEIYAFRFANRAAGSMGATGTRRQNSAASYRGTPFLTAEVGDGIEDTYFRRPVVDADDIASIVPVMLGSGVNLLGYYMFHGGRNPDAGSITLQESQRTGYPTDVPAKSYDFQAPLGEFGQERESLRKLKLLHYFLNDFGPLLAPMMTRPPDRMPSAPTDTTIPRVAARTSGDEGFVFFNNHVRGLQMPRRSQFQVELKLPSGVIRIPNTPIDLPSGAYGIWPVNFALSGATLRYSTAQLFKRIQIADQTYYFFFSLPGIPPEFALDSRARVIGASGPVDRKQTSDGIRLRMNSIGPTEVRLSDGVHLVLLPESQAEEVWRVDDPSLLLLTRADAFSEGGRWTLQKDSDPQIDFGIFGACVPTAGEGIELIAGDKEGPFQRYHTVLPPFDLQPRVTKIQSGVSQVSWKFGPKPQLKSTKIPLAPEAADFSHATTWRIEIPSVPPKAPVSNVFLKINYQGDVARLYNGQHLIDDNFWNGLPWTIGIDETIDEWRSRATDLQLSILPLPRAFPMHIEKAHELQFDSTGAADAVVDVRLVPQYQLVLNIASHPKSHIAQ
jgi:beta-galactosidase